MPSLGGKTIRALVYMSLIFSINASYHEYNMKMPQYAESFDDESKDDDSHPLLDYKFEDKVPENNYFPTDDVEENSLYKPTTTKYITAKLSEINQSEDIDFDVIISDQKQTSVNKYYTTRKPRFRVRDYNIDYDPQFNRRDRYNRRRKPIYRKVDDESEYSNSDNQYELNKKIYRRKPRDRQMTVTNDIGDYEHISTIKNKDAINRSHRRRKEKGRRRVGDEKYVSSSKKKYPKEYENYADYDDMRRVISIKDKLPTLLKKSKAREARTTEPSTTESEIDTNVTETVKDILTTETALYDVKKENETTTTNTIASEEIIDATTLTPNKLLQLVTQEISLAEKSRLSILRKTQKKDRVKGSRTKKPPVLLQLQTSLHTSNMNTIVMLEPSDTTSIDPEKVLRSREVSNDSEETLKKVKKLMRDKLMKNARSMNDLIDNWDEMICDYIDVSLLTNNVYSFQANIGLILICLASKLIMFL